MEMVIIVRNLKKKNHGGARLAHRAKSSCHYTCIFRGRRRDAGRPVAPIEAPAPASPGHTHACLKNMPNPARIAGCLISLRATPSKASFF
jgi:hypothetical protein